MKKKLRRLGIAAILLALIFGALYEWSTHTVRGWWNRDATFQGRPTSYWRARIDTWVERFPTPMDAENFLKAQTIDGILSSGAIIYSEPRSTFWNRARLWLGMAADPLDGNPPEILIQNDEAEPVLCELEEDPGLRRLVEQARKRRFVW